MIDYLIVILIFVGLEGAMYLIDLPFKKKIKEADSVESSLRTRRQLKVTRVISAFLLITLVIVVLIVIAAQNDTIDKLGQPLGIIIGYAIVKGWSMLKGNIQTYSKDEYLAKHKGDYAFYLRAFESDFYSNSRKASSLESSLAKAIKKRGFPIAAIGMTKELDAPVGASRVYVGDETWQSDVSELMRNAKMIFILMSDRESCIWEISNGAGMLDKICFIIDDTKKYENIEKMTSGKINFPDLDVLLGKLDNKISEADVNENDSHIGFMMNGNDVEAFEFGSLESPRTINSKLNEVSQIVKLL